MKLKQQSQKLHKRPAAYFRCWCGKVLKVSEASKLKNHAEPPECDECVVRQLGIEDFITGNKVDAGV